MTNLNQFLADNLTKEEALELSVEVPHLFGNHPSHKPGELPEYVREAMKKAGVVRTDDGKFVKVSSCK